MMQAVLHQFPATEVEYKLVCRSGEDLLPYKEEIEREIEGFCALSFTQSELDYLSGLRYIKPDFIEFLRIFKFNPNHILVGEEDGKLSIRIKGPWLHTILFEVPVMAIISEIYMRDNTSDVDIEAAIQEKNLDAITYLDPTAVVIDFGTRRRFSGEFHEKIVGHLSRNKLIVGTSNVLLASKFKITPIGTMAHEWLQAGQGMDGVRISHSQSFMLEKWVQEYRGDLGVALTDVIGMDAFLDDFDMYFMKLFDGCRHDSACPDEWFEKLFMHYKNANIDPITKMAVFSDGLDFKEVKRIHAKFYQRMKLSFGVGTFISNNLKGVDIKPLNMVIKMVTCNGHPVAKISDSPGKTICEDERYISYLKHVFKKED